MCIIPHTSYHWITPLPVLKVLSNSSRPSFESFGLLQICQILEVHLNAIIRKSNSAATQQWHQVCHPPLQKTPLAFLASGRHLGGELREGAGGLLGAGREGLKVLGREGSVLVGSFEPARRLLSNCDFLCLCLPVEDNLQWQMMMMVGNALTQSRSHGWVRCRTRSRTAAGS